MSKRDKDRQELAKSIFPVAKAEDYINVVWPDHIKAFLDEIDGLWFKGHNQEIPAYILKTCHELIDAPIGTFAENTTSMRSRAQAAYLSIVGVPSKPMSEETKAKLREINESKKAERDRKQQLSATGTGPLTVKEQILLDTSGFDNTTPKTVNKKAPNRGVPIWQDPVKQAELVTKYPWTVPGSFKVDPAKAASTILSIKCTKCGTNTREIHAADLFQVKMCLSCKSPKKVK